MPRRRTWPSSKRLLVKRLRADQKLGERKNPQTEKQRLSALRQKSRRLRPGLAIFSGGRNSFRSWLRKLKIWNGRRRWTKRITSTSRHRSKRRGSTRLWTPPKCPTLARSSVPPLPDSKPKNAIRFSWDWLGAG